MTPRPTRAERIGQAAWAAAVARQPLDVPARLVAGQLSARADRDGRVPATMAELACCTCLSVTRAYDALADLASREFVARDGSGFVLTRPGRGDPP